MKLSINTYLNSRFKTVSEPFNILCFEREPTEFEYTRKQQDGPCLHEESVCANTEQLGPCPQIMSLRLKTTRAINSKLIWCHLRPSWEPWTVAWANELLALRSILSNFTVYCCVKCSNVSRVFSEEHPFIFVSNNNAEMMAEVGYLWRFSCSLILWSSQATNYCS